MTQKWCWQIKSQKTCKIYRRKKSSDTLNCKLGHVGKKIKSSIIKANKEGKPAVFVSQMYSKSLTERRNVALKYRADLKGQDPSVQGYVKFQPY